MGVKELVVKNGGIQVSHVLCFKNVDVFIQRDAHDNVLKVEVDDRESS